MTSFFKYCAIVFLTATSSYAMAQLLNKAAPDYTNDTLAGNRAYQLLHIPAISNIKPGRKIVIAVIDDGFRLSHKALAAYIYSNPKEIPNNNIDDDKNGYVDDVSGWDMSDNDNNLTVPEGKEADLYHGTGIAGVIIKVIEKAYGNKAADYVRLLPVKVMADKSTKGYIENGYEGIDYALNNGADIICCAWSGGQFDREKHQSVFTRAQQKGVTIIGSAGNFYSQQVDPPASISSVYAVGAVDSNLVKIKSSNYHRKIDLVAFGDMVRAPHPLADNSYTFAQGTSSATALVAGCAGVLKIAKPQLSPFNLMSALKNTATPVDSLNRKYAGKLGAGLPDVTAAYAYLQAETGRGRFFNPQRTVGDIYIDKTSGKKNWQLNLAGGFKQIEFALRGSYPKLKNKLIFNSSQTYAVNAFPLQAVVKGGQVNMEWQGNLPAKPVVLSYTGIALDSATLYCSGKQALTADSGEITDGSGTANYNNDCDCKWQITVPEGKRVKLDFTQMDTQPNMDFVWVFTGTGTLQENILAKFSGQKHPPVIVSPFNQVLVWFVTDKQNTAGGWRLKYTATDEEAGVKTKAE